MTNKPDAPAPLPHDRTLRDRIWQPVRNSGWLVLLAAALGGGLVGVMANPFPAWCDAPKEAHVVCAREWVSAFGGYFGGVLTLVAAWIAFGPAKRSMEIQEIPILDARIKFLDNLSNYYFNTKLKYNNLMEDLLFDNYKEDYDYKKIAQNTKNKLYNLVFQNSSIQKALWESPSYCFKKSQTNIVNNIIKISAKIESDLMEIISLNNKDAHDKFTSHIVNEICALTSLCKEAAISIQEERLFVEKRRYELN